MRVVVTGGAGFIGSHLVDRLVRANNKVIVLDNLSTGKKEFIKQHFGYSNFKFHKVDLLSGTIENYFESVDEVWHMAANSDVRSAFQNTRIDLEQNLMCTYNVLEAMRENNVRKIIFASSSTVYGEAEKIPTPEDYAPLAPISLYGASKLACEGLISAYVHTFDFQACIIRLANIVGPRLTHGVIHDFISKVKKNREELEILGDGNQRKSYLHINDCVNAMFLIARNPTEKINIFNVASEDWISVGEIAKIVCKEMGVTPKLKFTGGDRGWKGDIPLMLLSISKLKSTGWKPKYNSEEAVKQTIKSLLGNSQFHITSN